MRICQYSINLLETGLQDNVFEKRKPNYKPRAVLKVGRASNPWQYKTISTEMSEANFCVYDYGVGGDGGGGCYITIHPLTTP